MAECFGIGCGLGFCAVAGAYQGGSAAGALAGLDIGDTVADHDGSGQVQMVFFCRSKEQTGFGFPARAGRPVRRLAVFGMVRAVVDAVHRGARFRQLPAQQKSNVRHNPQVYFCESCGAILVWDTEST